MPSFSRFRRCICIASCVMSPMLSAKGLPELIQLATEQHPIVAAAQANIASAEASVATANWQYYPTLSMSVEGAYHSAADTSYAGDDLVAQLNLNQPLWNWGALRAGVDIAETNLTIASADLYQQRWQLSERVIEAYGKWLAAYLGMRAWQQGLDDHQNLLQQVEKRVKQGVSAQIDLALAQGRVASTEAEYIASDDALQLALLELRQLTESPLVIDDLVAHIAAPWSVQSDEASLTVTPAMAVAEAEVRLMAYQIEEQQAQLKPEIYLRAEHQINDYSTANTQPRSRVFIGVRGSTGAGLSMQTRLQSVEADLHAKQANLMAVKRQAQQDLSNLKITMASLQRRLASLDNAMTTTEAVSNSYGRQFLAGRKSWQEVMNAAREKVQMQVQIADLEAAFLVASWRYGLNTQGLQGLIDSKPLTLDMNLEMNQ